MTTGYTVTAEVAVRWTTEHQTKRDDGRDRYMVMERKSKGGFGVWDLKDQCWVYVD